MNVSKSCCKESRLRQLSQLSVLKKVSLLTAISFCLHANAMAFHLNHLPPSPKYPANQNVKPITGKVTDNTGKALANVSVTIRGTNRGTATNADGVFKIEANKGETLEFSIVGYQTVSLTVGDATVMDLSMEIASAALSDIVVV